MKVLNLITYRRILTASLFAMLVITSAPSLYSQEPLAKPNFMGRPITGTLFGLSSASVNLEPGIWGCLLLTESQGDKLREVWEATQWRRISEKLTGDAAKTLETQFHTAKNGIMTPSQRELVVQINQLAAAMQKERTEGILSGPSLIERVTPILTTAQIEWLEQTRGQTP